MIKLNEWLEHPKVKSWIEDNSDLIDSGNLRQIFTEAEKVELGPELGNLEYTLVLVLSWVLKKKFIVLASKSRFATARIFLQIEDLEDITIVEASLHSDREFGPDLENEIKNLIEEALTVDSVVKFPLEMMIDIITKIEIRYV